MFHWPHDAEVFTYISQEDVVVVVVAEPSYNVSTQACLSREHGCGTLKLTPLLKSIWTPSEQIAGWHSVRGGARSRDRGAFPSLFNTPAEKRRRDNKRKKVKKSATCSLSMPVVGGAVVVVDKDLAFSPYRNKTLQCHDGPFFE